MSQEIIVFGDVHIARARQALRLLEAVDRSESVAGVINNGTSISAESFLKKLWLGYASRERQAWQGFYDAIDRLNKEYYEVPGSHPHRFPPPDMQRIMPTLFGEHELLRRTKYKGHVSAEQNVGPYHCLFLEAQRPRQRWNLGFDCGEIADGELRLAKSVAERMGRETLYIFLHCPLVNSRESRPGRMSRLSLDNFEQSRAKAGLGHNVIRNGCGKLLALLSSYAKNFIIVTSHSRIPKYYLIDKKLLTAKEVSLQELNDERNSTLFIKQVSTPCLGSAGSHGGYLSITLDAIRQVALDEVQVPEIRRDITRVQKDTRALVQSLENHRTVFIRLERVILRERKIFEDVKDELRQMAPLFEKGAKQSAAIIKRLDNKLKESMKEYRGSHERELRLVRESLRAAHTEYTLYEEILPEVQAVFSDMNIKPSDPEFDRYRGTRSVFLEWYKASILHVRELSGRIIYDEKLFNNKEKKIINELHRIIKSTNRSGRHSRLVKVREEIDAVSLEIDSFLLDIPANGEAVSLTLYSLSADIRKAIRFLDTVLRILNELVEALEKERGKLPKII